MSIPAAQEKAALVSCFLGECERQFRFLELDHSFQYLSGLSEYKNGRQIIRPIAPSEAPESYHLVTRYEKGDVALEFSYSNADYILDCMLYADRIHRVHLEEIMQAVKKSMFAQKMRKPAAQPEILQLAIEDLSNIVRKNHEWVTDPDERLIERALLIRQKMLEHSLRQQLRHEISMASAQAAKAFLQKDYPRVIVILRPYEPFLCAADLKKLQFARKQMMS